MKLDGYSATYNSPNNLTLFLENFFTSLEETELVSSWQDWDYIYFTNRQVYMIKQLCETAMKNYQSACRLHHQHLLMLSSIGVLLASAWM